MVPLELEARQTSRRVGGLLTIFAFSLAFIVLYIISLQDYLAFHIVVELASISVATMMFLLVWHARTYHENPQLVHLGAAYMAAALLDFVHTLAYRGMGVFPGDTSNLATQLWLAARYMQSISVLVFALSLGRTEFKRPHIIGSHIAGVFLLLTSIWGGLFPTAYVDGVGLTPFKIISEYVISALFLITIAVLQQRKDQLDTTLRRFLIASLGVAVASELLFTQYIGVYDTANLLGHFLKIISFYLIYKAVIVTGLERPYALLFRDLQQSERALRESEARFRVALGSGEFIVAHVDTDLRYTWIHNPHPDFDPGAVIGKRDDELDSPDNVADLVALKKDVIATGQTMRREVSFSRSDGLRVYDVVAEPMHDAQGHVVGVTTAAVDIDERKKQDLLLERRLHSLSVLYNASQVLLTTSDPEQILQRLCDLAVEAFSLQLAWVGLRDTESEPLSFQAWSGPETDYAMWVSKVIDGPWDWEIPAHRAYRSGEPIAVRLDRPGHGLPEEGAETLKAHGLQSLVAIPLQVDGKCIGVLAAYASEPACFDSEDVQTLQYLANLGAMGLQRAWLYEQIEGYAQTLEQQVAERTADLRESEERFRAIFDHSAMGIALLTPKGRIIQANAALQQMLCCNEEEILNQRHQKFLQPDDLKEDALLYQSVAEGERSQLRVARRYTRCDGQVRWGNATISLMQRDGWPWFIALMLQDVTEARQTQQALLQAAKLNATGRLAASFAHEIKNPLTAVIGCLGLAKEMLEDGQDISEFLEVAHNEVVRANGLVERLRNLNQNTNLEERVPTNVNELIHRVLMLNQKQAQDQGVELRAELADDLPQPELASDAMQQVFLNLTLNALDAMPEGGRLTVRSEYHENPQGIRVFFEDTGIGMSPDVADRIFEGFYSTRQDGLGLGLFVSLSIVEQHGGHIELDTEKGRGTTFVVCLPA